MADDWYTDERLPSQSTSVGPDSSGASAGPTGAFFPGAHHFVVAGGQFISNIIEQPAPEPSDFRRIPLGDLDLRNEIRLDAGSGVVHFQTERICARLIYTALVEGKQSDMTVAVYRGAYAEKNWKREIEKHIGIRHPNVVQLYGTVSSGGLYATVFHDGLAGASQQVHGGIRSSMISTVYLYGFFKKELGDAIHYLDPAFSGDIAWQIILQPGFWIRRSTGRICVEPSKNFQFNRLAHPPAGDLPDLPLPALRGDRENSMISSLTLPQYHEICYSYLAKTHWFRAFHDTIRAGAIISVQTKEEIAQIPNIGVDDTGWRDPGGEDHRVVMENGWTRFYCPYGPVMHRILWPRHRGTCWLSQANHISNQYPISVNHGWVWQIKYEIIFSTLSDDLPGAYLFLCPMNDLRSEDGSFIGERPECPAYWSFDPAGREQLSPDVVSAIGLPSLGWEREILCRSWDTHVYSGLSQFHAAKGFDPNTQDVARHLGEALYELSCDPRIEEVIPNEGDPVEDVMSAETHLDTQKTDYAHHTFSKIKYFTLCLPAVHNLGLIVAGAFGMILALISVYLYSLINF
ncbi:hypothetical protein B0H16DRAFT_1882189 [Mycena metata]|uniref:Protein kinase domain-containing protein n=1 Tax=Mycena metata TaxID=1033252 RepID=A0AAD7NNA7_9AGAR|nr:hypothetical protein B0H16DRAFT_1882189 [Mycena metata]